MRGRFNLRLALSCCVCLQEGRETEAGREGRENPPRGRSFLIKMISEQQLTSLVTLSAVPTNHTAAVSCPIKQSLFLVTQEGVIKRAGK